MNIPLQGQWTERLSTLGIFDYVRAIIGVLGRAVGNYRLGAPSFDGGSITIPIDEYGRHLADLHIDHHFRTMRYRLDNGAMDRKEADDLLHRIDAALFRELDGVILNWPGRVEGRDV